MGELISICASIGSSCQEYDTRPKPVTSRATDQCRMKPIRRQPESLISPVLFSRSDLSDALLSDEAIKFREIYTTNVLTDYTARGEISPAVLKRLGDTTRQNMSVLSSALREFVLSNAREMTTRTTKIALRAPGCERGRAKTISDVTRISNSARREMAFSKRADTKFLRSVAVVSEDVDYIGAAFGRAL